MKNAREIKKEIENLGWKVDKINNYRGIEVTILKKVGKFIQKFEVMSHAKSKSPFITPMLRRVDLSSINIRVNGIDIYEQLKNNDVKIYEFLQKHEWLDNVVKILHENRSFELEDNAQAILNSNARIKNNYKTATITCEDGTVLTVDEEYR